MRRPGVGHRSAGLAVTLVLALLGAPVSSALRNECNLCPRSCPMHQVRDRVGHEHEPRLKCHAGPAASAPEHHRATPERGPSFRRAACGNHGVVTATVLPPMLLPAALARLFVPTAAAVPVPNTAGRGRLADPPDTPPPIVAA